MCISLTFRFILMSQILYQDWLTKNKYRKHQDIGVTNYNYKQISVFLKWLRMFEKNQCFVKDHKVVVWYHFSVTIIGEDHYIICDIKTRCTTTEISLYSMNDITVPQIFYILYDIRFILIYRTPTRESFPSELWFTLSTYITLFKITKKHAINLFSNTLCWYNYCRIFQKRNPSFVHTDVVFSIAMNSNF